MDDSRCKYAYKPCPNPRVAKKDGGLHRLCEFHRDKANAVQKTYATRRRRERRTERREKLVQKLLGNIEPVPFNGQREYLSQDERAKLEAELAALIDDDSNDNLDGLDEDPEFTMPSPSWSGDYADEELEHSEL